ncbi:Protease 4 [Hondaea fermentalgiana]|uniref:Protease 4 n=1 Tax=Hondaea fermentalgiana TaxID=2315210 RepID=A0A2R5GIV3_9STRA|nr:Protease 4 [Hondaea fermentalgiana]|eukprot:GBG30535.1 Protease 4 [Hondaea fermentalgiana]
MSAAEEARDGHGAGDAGGEPGEPGEVGEVGEVAERESWAAQERRELAATPVVSRRRKAAGVGALVAGAALVSWQHRAKIVSTTRSAARVDTLGVVCAAAGAGLLAPALWETKPEAFVPFAPTHARLRADDAASVFDFKVLNRRWRAEVERMEANVGFSPFWFPADIQELFHEAYEKQRQERRERLLAKEKDLEDRVREDLQAGKSPRKVLQSLGRTVFVLDFSDYESIGDAEDIGEGDWDRRVPSGTVEWVSFLRDAVSFLLKAASEYDEIVIRLASPGGSVTDYGLAASHLLRLRKAGIKVTVCIDEIAASGGYMMACCADRIVAAPFALIGSIGVVAEIPNFNRLLKDRIGIDYLLFTAGRYKRTVHTLAENTEEGMDKFREELEAIHDAFKQHVTSNRPAVKDIESSATGEAWLASQAKERGLVDDLMTSDELLEELETAGRDLIAISLKRPKPRRVLSHLLWDLLDLDEIKHGLHSLRALLPSGEDALAGLQALRHAMHPRKLLARL